MNSTTDIKMFGRLILPCGHIVDWDGTRPQKDDCELERRLTTIEAALNITQCDLCGEYGVGITELPAHKYGYCVEENNGR